MIDISRGLIDYALDDDGIASIVWNMAGHSRNLITEESATAFAAAVGRAISDDAVKGVIITSARDDFLAGADLAMLAALTDPVEIMERGSVLQMLLRRIETCGKPFVAAVNGTAVGGGYEICLACHHSVVADDSAIRIGLPEVKLGLLPGAGGTQRLARRIGARAALPLLLEGRTLSPADALAAGMIDRVVPKAALLDEARRWLLDTPDPVKPWDRPGFRVPGGMVYSPKGMETFIAGNAMLRDRTYGNYPAPQAIMSCVFEGLQVPLDVGLRIESRWFTWLLRRPEARNMIRTLFFGIGDANKLKRRPAGHPRAAYRRIGVLGAGMMGSGIAFVSARAGLEVVLLDTDLSRAEAGRNYNARIPDDERQALRARITPTMDFADLAGCELVIEAVYEDRAIKAEVTRQAEAVIGADAIFASNTSTLPITGLAEASSRPESFIGLHFFSPVDKMRLVEIILGGSTSESALAKAMDYVQRIGKTPIVVNDSRGFYTSRVFATYIEEGLAMLAEGVLPSLIENAGRMAGMPVGPLAVADEVSLELVHRVRQQTRRDLGEAYRAGAGDAVIATMVETLGRLGKKARKGFYAYPEDGRKHLWPELAIHFPPADRQPPVDEVIDRLLTIQGIEAVRCLEENVVTAAIDADVGSVLGWGFAPFHGGVLGMIDTLGVAEFTARCDSYAQRFGSRFAPPSLLRRMVQDRKTFYSALGE